MEWTLEGTVALIVALIAWCSWAVWVGLTLGRIKTMLEVRIERLARLGRRRSRILKSHAQRLDDHELRIKVLEPEEL